MADESFSVIDNEPPPLTVPLYGSIDSEAARDSPIPILVVEKERAPKHRGCIPRFFHKWKYALVICFLDFVFGSAGVSIQPITPGIKRRYFGGDQEAARITTILDAVVAFLALLLAPLWGTLMDSVGRRPFFLFEAASAFVPSLLLLVSPVNPLPYMIANRVFGLVSFSFHAAYLADHYSSKLRASVYAFSLASGQLTNLTAMFAVGLSNQTIMNISFVLNCVGALAACFLVKESLPRERRKKFSFGSLENPFRAMKSVMTSKIVIAAVVVMGILSVSNDGTSEIYLYFLNQRIGFNKEDNGLMFIEMGVLMFIMQAIGVPLLTRVFKLRQATLIMVSCVALTGAMLSMCFLTALWQVYAFGMVFTSLAAIAVPCLTALIANSGKEEEQGRRLTGYTALSDLFAALASLIFGQTYANLHGNWVLLPFVLAAVASVPAFAVSFMIRRWVIQGEIVVDDAEDTGSLIHDDEDSASV